MLKVIKTDWQNRLTDDAFTDFMHISLDSADLKEFNPDPAIHLWQQEQVCGQGQRPTQKIWKKVKAKETRNESDVEADVSEYSEGSQQWRNY